MTFDRVAEIEALLDLDEAREGRLWRWYRDGRTDAEWQVANNVKTPPTNARHTITALTYGVVPSGPTYAAVDAGAIRRWLKTKELSTELREALAAQLKILDEVAAAAREPQERRETAAQVAAIREVVVQRGPGVYVYSLPIYLAHPVDEESQRTLIKVGHSAVDVFNRVASQSRTTALPEDPILLRVYPCESSAGVEAKFHDRLKRVGHLRSGITAYAGKEWFLTTLDFLDGVAAELDLEILVINNP